MNEKDEKEKKALKEAIDEIDNLKPIELLKEAINIIERDLNNPKYREDLEVHGEEISTFILNYFNEQQQTHQRYNSTLVYSFYSTLMAIIRQLNINDIVQRICPNYEEEKEEIQEFLVDVIEKDRKQHPVNLYNILDTEG